MACRDKDWTEEKEAIIALLGNFQWSISLLHAHHLITTEHAARMLNCTEAEFRTIYYEFRRD